MLTRFLWVALALGLGSTVLGAGGFSHGVPMDPESRDSIEVTSFMDNLPTAGFMPLKVVINNRSTSDQVWQLLPMMNQSDWMQASWSFPVKAGSRGEFEIMVPLKTGNFNYRWGAQFNWSGPGVSTAMMQLPQSGSSNNSGTHPFVGLSDSLHRKHWGGLESELSDLAGCALHLPEAPADWRGWIALDQTWMTVGEWKALPDDKKQALLEAVALRNELALVCASAEEAQAMRQAFQLAEPNTRTKWAYGAGQVRLMVGGDTGATLAAAIRQGNRKGEDLENYRLSPWLEKATPPVETAGPLVLLFIVLFGIIAGPVNLFLLAPAGRRHRLFVTTPLISLAGAVVLAAAIFIQDGTGGSGTRLIHAQVLPEAKKLLITQEQVARCGLLLGTSFRTSDPVWIQPLTGDRSDAYSRRGMRHASEADGRYSGDWFRSRTRQHHCLQSTRPSRAAIEFTPGETPSVVSTFEGELAQLWVHDEAGKAWLAENVRTGERVTLRPVDKDAVRTWWKQKSDETELRGLLDAVVEGVGAREACFFAQAKDPGGLPIDTLPSIRWQTPLVLVSGPLTLKP